LEYIRRQFEKAFETNDADHILQVSFSKTDLCLFKSLDAQMKLEKNSSQEFLQVLKVSQSRKKLIVCVNWTV